MANEKTIPALPCRSIKEMLEFYVALGFEITYQQERPSTYAVVQYEDIHLHFFTMKGYEPKDSYTTCLVLVPDLAGLHQVFSSGLRAHYGKLPVAGIPRISKLNNANSDKQLRFNVIDPGGNWVRFIPQSEQPAANDGASQQETQTKLSRATHAADWLVEAHGDYPQAAQMLDKALAQSESASPEDHVRALVLRSSIAVALADAPFALRLLATLRDLPLDDTQRITFAAELERATDLERSLS